jgi:flagellar biosynthesis anti-sigma factor FlgM
MHLRGVFMRVGFNPSDPQDLSTERTATASAADSESAAFEQSSEASLSDAASSSALASQALQTSEMREEKVESLRQQVASGQYQPDAEASAESMLSEAC